MENNAPRIIEETDDYAVVFKPPRMHSAPLKQKTGGSLFEWYAENHPPVYDIMHRLDYETHGLILIAKTKESFEHFKTLQNEGGFVKEYSAICAEAGSSVNVNAAGFPPPPDLLWREPSPEKPLVIMSYFRPFGPGRKQVRPVTDTAKKSKEIAKDKGGFYRTEIISRDGNFFTVRIKRGFRHQIRCHLSWIGCPILNDSLYNVEAQNSESALESIELALRAHALFFTDPSSGKLRECRIAALSF